jgi:hypothetical protein
LKWAAGFALFKADIQNDHGGRNPYVIACAVVYIALHQIIFTPS